MRVHEVVPARRVRRLDAEHLEGEVAYLGGDVRLVELFERPRGHVPDEDAGSQFGDRRGIPGDRSRKDLHLGTSLRQALGDLNDVDVEPSGVAGARLIER
jgi:hypothetical protein